MVEKLDPRKYNTQASNLIKKFKLNPDNFPKLIEHQRYGAIRSFVTRHDWMKAEEISKKYPGGLNLLVNVLVKGQQYEEAISVAQRHSLEIPEHLRQIINQKCPFPKPKINKLLEDDYFGPTEVFLHGHNVDEYLTLGQFGVEEKDVLFITKESDEHFEKSIKHFLEVEMVGCDSEFRGKMTKFDKGGVSTL